MLYQRELNSVELIRVFPKLERVENWIFIRGSIEANLTCALNSKTLMFFCINRIKICFSDFGEITPDSGSKVKSAKGLIQKKVGREVDQFLSKRCWKDSFPAEAFEKLNSKEDNEMWWKTAFPMSWNSMIREFSTILIPEIG
jgi:hypothetical protein